MIVVSAGSLEDCEAAGERLLAHGITPQILEGAVYVPDEDAERARDVLGYQKDVPPEFDQPAPFHPCPNCATPDPIWYGKRKATVLVVALLVLIALTLHFQSAAVTTAAIITIIAIMVVAAKLPEWECRQCGHRWLKEPVD